MLYPYWSSLKTVTLPAWLRAGQLCLCSQDPDLSKSRVGIDCWLGDRWATNRSWTLALQIPALDDPAWHTEPLSCPPDSRRPVVLAVQDPRYGGFRLGRCRCATPGGWLMYNSGQWDPIHQEAVLGWLTIPHRLSHRARQPLQASRQRLLAHVR